MEQPLDVNDSEVSPSPSPTSLSRMVASGSSVWLGATPPQPSIVHVTSHAAARNTFDDKISNADVMAIPSLARLRPRSSALCKRQTGEASALSGARPALRGPRPNPLA